MAKQTIQIGSAPNDGTGSTIRAGGDIINDNFNEIYTAFGDGNTLVSGLITGKSGGTNFTNSLIVGHGITGTLNAAQNNVAVGKGSIESITEGDHNTALGFDTLKTLTTASGNTAVGRNAGKLLTSDNNTVVGEEAGTAISTGGHNTFVGHNAGKAIETGSGNVIIGNAVGNSASTTKQMSIAATDGVSMTTWLEGDSTGKVVVAADPTAPLGIATKQYVDAVVATENEISEMNDVTLTSISSGDVLQWNGAAFVNIALSSAVSAVTGTLGTIATQNANAVNITGGSITMGSLSNTSTLLVKNSSGTTLKTIIGTTS